MHGGSRPAEEKPGANGPRRPLQGPNPVGSAPLKRILARGPGWGNITWSENQLAGRTEPQGKTTETITVCAEDYCCSLEQRDAGGTRVENKRTRSEAQR